MISRETVLKRLPPYQGMRIVVSSDQTVGDIISGIIATHKDYRDDYDKICILFDNDDSYAIARNIFDFLKRNVNYRIESEMDQSLKSPSAIVAEGIDTGGDCKSYALFAGGVIEALNRNEGAGIPFVFRFASYDRSNSSPEHVFIVMYPGTDDEIWVDPVLNYLDEKKIPYFYKDKKIKAMALSRVSGVNSKMETVGGATDFLNLLGPLGSSFNAILSIFGQSGPNPNDWQGWDHLDQSFGEKIGNQAAYWILFDGDSPQNEASNIISWIKAHGDQAITLIENSSWGSSHIDDLASRFISKLQNAGINPSTYTALPAGGGNGGGNGRGGIIPGPSTEGGGNTLAYVGIGLALVLALKK